MLINNEWIVLLFMVNIHLLRHQNVKCALYCVMHHKSCIQSSCAALVAGNLWLFHFRSPCGGLWPFWPLTSHINKTPPHPLRSCRLLGTAPLCKPWRRLRCENDVHNDSNLLFLIVLKLSLISSEASLSKVERWDLLHSVPAAVWVTDWFWLWNSDWLNESWIPRWLKNDVFFDCWDSIGFTPAPAFSLFHFSVSSLFFPIIFF